MKLLLSLNSFYYAGQQLVEATTANNQLCGSSAFLHSHQGEHRPKQGPAGYPRGQLSHQPLVQGTGQWLGLRDHPRVPQDACPQEESQLFPHSHLLFGVRGHHRSLPMCHLEAQLI